MIAEGEQTPKAAYFCLQVESENEIPTLFGKYKPEQGGSNDVLAQLLMAMLYAQEENRKNNITIPIYGAYAIGRMFHFVVLENKEFDVSSGHIGSTNQIFDIFCILKEVKTYIESYLA